MDDQAAGLKRGEFVASVRQFAACFHWSLGAVLRFLETLLQNSMIMRVGHQAGQEAGHFAVCNYDSGILRRSRVEGRREEHRNGRPGPRPQAGLPRG